ncbi:MAG: hypothetical protein CMJ81_10325 [Planctomycetaceae bacterium]|jgi:hypothetical protein|nr:hypothetical protein [Planctomycetaceae bacterium]MBP62556.1 hypothetical protein [Planctomycetaceae bacterium]
MFHDGRYKLIYYPVGNVRQLFDIAEDPREQRDLSSMPGQAKRLESMTGRFSATATFRWSARIASHVRTDRAGYRV